MSIIFNGYDTEDSKVCNAFVSELRKSNKAIVLEATLHPNKLLWYNYHTNVGEHTKDSNPLYMVRTRKSWILFTSITYIWAWKRK